MANPFSRRSPLSLVAIAVTVLFALHYLFTHSGLESSKTKLKSTPPALKRPARTANATIVMLARNSDLEGAVESIKVFEERINSNFGYPWTFLNDEPFDNAFKNAMKKVIKAPIEFGLIPKEHWVQPDWIDEDRARQGRKAMEALGIEYATNVPYRNMCRYNSGFFFRHELLQKYRYYWRVEPDVDFFCQVKEDPFLFMQDHNKTYGFNLILYEWPATIATLWGHVRNFIQKHPEYLPHDNSMGFISQNGGVSYNTCHFWSNFEIADLDFWRGEAYTKFFEYLDQVGGFYYERWGDAPVHSIAAALFLPRTQVHFFENIGYRHNELTHCPLSTTIHKEGNCQCDPLMAFDYHEKSCKPKWDQFMQTPL